VRHADPQTLLPVAADCDGRPLVTGDGRPVWPLRDDDDRVALEHLATVFGARLDRRRAEVGAARDLSDEVVVGLGPESESAAVLYAHLTRRRSRSVRDLDALKRRGRPSVLVATPARLTHELLEWLYGGSDESAPGIICGDAGAPLRRQVLLRAAAAALCGPVDVLRSNVFPTLSMGTIRERGCEVLGAQSSAAERHRALEGGAGVLTVMTHSDGVDAFMGADLTLCAMSGAANDRANLSTAPRCRLTGFCHRHEMPVSEARKSGALFAPEKIAARVFVWDVCFGVMPTHSFVDPRWGIGRRLLDSASVGAIVTTWRIVLDSPDQIARLSDTLASGAPVGTAVARFNASRIPRGRRHRLCLLGDPRVRVPVTPVRARLAAGPMPRRTAADDGRLAQAALLRLSMVDAKERAPRGPRSVLPAKALESVEAYEGAAARGAPVDDVEREHGDDMRTAVLDYAMARGKLLEAWMPFVRDFRAAKSRGCPVCGRRADTVHATLQPPRIYTRRLVLCPICGVMEDAPTTSRIRMDLVGKRVRLEGALPRHRWAAGVLVQSSYQSDALQVKWPAANDGTPAPAVDLPDRWPPGPLRLSAFVVWDATFAVFSRMTRDPRALVRGRTPPWDTSKP
jgi:hypothetical protein